MRLPGCKNCPVRFRFGRWENSRSAAHGGIYTIITNVCGTTPVLKKGTPEVPRTSWRYYVRGTAWIGTKSSVCPAAVLFL